MPRFIKRVEDFTCAQCREIVRGSGFTNHCPSCLYSMHVDIYPGDRAEECGGMMEPIGALHTPNGYVLIHQCEACGAVRRNKASPEDDRGAIQAVAGRPVDDPA